MKKQYLKKLKKKKNILKKAILLSTKIINEQIFTQKYFNSANKIIIFIIKNKKIYFYIDTHFY